MEFSSEIREILAEGAKFYASKKFDEAAEKYGEACEIYSEKHGEESIDLLLLYGKALFQNAVTKSDVFGGAEGGKAEEDGDGDGDEVLDEKDGKKDGNFQFCDEAPLAEEEASDGEDAKEEAGDEKEVTAQEEGGEEKEEKEGQQKENKEGEDDEKPEEEQSDFEVAWEILDLARSLLEKNIDAVPAGEKEVKAPYLPNDNADSTNEFVVLLKKLSETYDLLGELSLEAENFTQAATDLENCLNLRLKLFNPKNSSLISESHYKLSLALELCVEDPDLKQKAAKHIQLAIASVERTARTETDPTRKKETEILLQDLRGRAQDIEKDPAEEFKNEQLNIIKGILGEQVEGDSNKPHSNSLVVNDLSSIVKKKSAKPAVNDLTAAVKKRKPTTQDPSASKKSKK